MDINFSRNELGFRRVAAVAPSVNVADVDLNTSNIIDAASEASSMGADYILFPELSISGYTCGDLFYQAALIEKCNQSLNKITVFSKTIHSVIFVGLPIQHSGLLYNCAAVISEGSILGLIPKKYLPNRGEYYEQRWFSSGLNLSPKTIILSNGSAVQMSADAIFSNSQGTFKFGVEICEDLWAPTPSSSNLITAGAHAIFNLSASNEVLGKAEYRRNLIKSQSGAGICAYIYASAGPGESSTDIVFSGHCVISEAGSILSESERFSFDNSIIYADIDSQKIDHDRHLSSSFSISSAKNKNLIDVTYFKEGLPRLEIMSPFIGSFRKNPRLPFVPDHSNTRAAVCEEIFSIQSTGLEKRLRYTGIKKVVIGISGGLDSTLALLVAVRVFDRMGLDRSGIIAPTMPGFGTSEQTKMNAIDLVKKLGATLLEIPITTAVTQHFSDIDQDINLHDLIFENAQARERTQILMDLANKYQGLVVGTGDLSESALGWCTFNGDHMSMYHVNIGVPKTLVRYMVEWCSKELFADGVGAILKDICETPISPELLPLSGNNTISQKTEEIIGPYELHDYFLFAFVRCGYSPLKIFYMAKLAYGDKYSNLEMIEWLKVFIDRFFSQQFKRSVMPDGPKVGSVALSPRGDWRMPSDASPALWLKELEELTSHVGL